MLKVRKITEHFSDFGHVLFVYNLKITELYSLQAAQPTQTCSKTEK